MTLGALLYFVHRGSVSDSIPAFTKNGVLSSDFMTAETDTQFGIAASFLTAMTNVNWLTLA